MNSPNQRSKQPAYNKTSSSDKKKSTSDQLLPSKVAQWYYKHGLFLTSYPTCATSLAFLAIFACCYPLFNYSPLPGKIPTKVVLPFNYQHSNNVALKQSEDITDNKINDHEQQSMNQNQKTFLSFDTSQFYNLYNNLSSASTFPSPSSTWARLEPPFAYVQQIILKSIVLPWEKELVLNDAFRGPLFEVFKLLEIINNHETNVTLSNLCLHVENAKRSQKETTLFPEYNCLILSPANFWKQNIHEFNKDNSLLNTIYQYHNNQKSKISIAEMFFGIPLLDTGVKRYPIQNRPRIIQYAVTLLLRENNQDFIKSLQQKLEKIYPLHQNQDEGETSQKQNSSIVYIFYPEEFNLIELVPLSIAMTVLFIYMYFSIRKVEMIRSRFIVALASVATVMGSLGMSLGLCFFFGLTVSSMGVYPYLLILVGLENCLVLTKSVMTTENNLDVKIRVAQGLSKEGWSITKNLMTEITILTAGLVLTFLPVIQEFCIFAMVGLVSDYFLQMLLFSTFLGLNVKRIEVITEVKKLPKMFDHTSWHNARDLRLKYSGKSFGITNVLNRSKSHPSQLSNLDQQHLKDASSSKEKKIPKRLRLFNFWARTRFFQRGFMIWMVLWISNIIYTSGIIENLFLIDMNNSGLPGEGHATSDGKVESVKSYDTMVKNLSSIMIDYYAKNVQWNRKIADENLEHNITEKIQKLKFPAYELSSKLSTFHWAGILKQYNVTMSGKYVSILPSIKLSHVVSSEVAMKIRNPNEKPPTTSKWSALTSALDPLDLNDSDGTEDLHPMPLYPKTPFEFLLTIIICLVSIIVITYTMIVMYRCICSRNYAEWRSSRWDENERLETKTEQVLEGFPIQVKGHRHCIECVVTDGNLIASSCLQGLLKIWDSTTGELVAEIDRITYFEQLQQYNVDRRVLSISDENLIQSSPKTAIHEAEQSYNHVRLRNSLKFDFNCAINRNSDPDTIKNEFQLSYEKYFAPASILNGSFDASSKSSSSPPLCNNNHHQYNNMTNNNINIHHLNNSSDNINEMRYSGTKCSSPIWSLDFIDNLIVIGCADGRCEFWEGTTGNFKCIYETESTFGDGVTHIKLNGDKVIVARLSGKIDFLRLETYTQGRQIDWNFTSAYRRTHVRTGSAGSISNFNQQQTQRERNIQRNSLNLSTTSGTATNSMSQNQPSNTNQSPTQEELRCILEAQSQGHMQPISCLDVLGNLLFTGSQDHLLKVFHTDSNTLHYTLHGHCSPITALIIDHFQSGTGASGSQEGLLCVWDLITGACLYNLQAHEDCIVSIASAPSYIITLGLDERLRVWERFQGNLLNTINLNSAYSNSIVMLTPSLLITAKPGALLVWDVKENKSAHEVKLDRSEMSQQISPKIMLPSYGSVICDYGQQLRIVRFPLHVDKKE